MTAKKKTLKEPRGAQPTRGPEVMDANEAAALLSAHVETVRRLARRGDIPSFKVGKDWRFEREALVRWSERQPVGNEPTALMPEHDAVVDADARPAALAPGEPVVRERELGSGATPGALRKKAPDPKGRPEGAAPVVGPGRTQGGSFPIVGVGASAGGLEALEQFLRPLPDQCGMAFVVVQHLDPTHKGMMAELLQRATTMKVTEVKDRDKVEPNHVYVIPPNKDLSILRGVLHLLAPAAPRGLRLPIDFFFRSLAGDQKERSIGVILSGMGSDGTLGLRAIKEQAGAVFVQAPASAKFDAMPRSVIDAGLADIVAPAEELGAKAIAYLAHVPLASPTDQGLLAGKTQSAIEKVCLLLRDQTGHDFSEYKRSTVYRRIERRMALHQLDSVASYVRYLSESPQEAQLLFKELLIGVTSFFRDPAAWEHLRQKVIPALLEERPSGGTLRAWVPGCSTGEEAYSLAIVFKEALAQVKPAKSYSLQIFATDLDKDAIDKARHGVFPANIVGDVSEERLRRFFIKGEHGYQVGQEIRETVIFAPQNLIMDPPFTKLDILSCRNLLIYLSAELQKRLLPLFHYSLNPRGILFFGSAETVGSFTDLFAPLNGKARIYRRLDAAMRAEPVALPVSFFHRARAAENPAAQPSARPVANLQTLADQLLLTRYAPAAVLTNDKGDILYISGRTGKYLEPAAGRANWNIYAMAREGLRYELGATFQKALREKHAVTHPGMRVGTNDGEQSVGVTIEPLQEPPALRGMVMVMFADEPTPAVVGPSAKAHRRSPAASVALARSEQELREAREELQSTREEMQTSQEELKSANEELQSTNEELQSGNEELTTSREEMQSLNEELQTLNHELQSKVDELTRSNNDMRNLLESTDIATLFLDNDLNVRRFTSQITKIIKLIPSDAGRPLTDLSSDLVYPGLPDDAREVLRTLGAKETAIATNDGRWFTVRVMPYRTLDNRIDGVVITFIDITTAKTLEGKLRHQAGHEATP